MEPKKNTSNISVEFQKTRLQTQFKKMELQPQSTGISHFGFNVDDYVNQAMQSGDKGNLDAENRRKMYGEINRFGPITLPKNLEEHIKKHNESGDVFKQTDNRVNPRKGGNYKGFMITTTKVSDDNFDSTQKIIQEPNSPRPNVGKSQVDRTHASPFNSGGPDTNNAKTVWAPSWANITVDGNFEKNAKKQVKQGENIFSFRLDSHERSTVGYARIDSKSKKIKDVHAAQYKRKLDQLSHTKNQKIKKKK